MVVGVESVKVVLTDKQVMLIMCMQWVAACIDKFKEYKQDSKSNDINEII